MKLLHQRGINARSAVALLLRQILFRNIADKDVENVAVSRKLRKMTVVIYPADTAVLTDDTVFYMIAVRRILTLCLLLDRMIDHLIVLRVHHTFKGVSGQLSEFFLRFTAVHVLDSAVDIQQLHTLVGAVDKKSTGDLLSDPFDGRSHIPALK